MRTKFNLFAALIAAVALAFGGTLAPAQASGLSANIALSNGSLAGSTVTAADPSALLQMTVIASVGKVQWNNVGSGVMLISRQGATAQVLTFQGNQDQLTAALAEITVIAPCQNGQQNISIQVTTGSDIVNPQSGHIYRYVNSNLNWDDTKTADETIPLVPGGSDTFGYMAAISSSVENAIVASLNPGQLWLPASDAATEGDWTWTTGPEAGTHFYLGAYPTGAAVNGIYNDWNGGEPNNSGGSENWGVMNSDGTWNDAPQQFLTMPSVVEFGGMSGDNLGQMEFSLDDATISSTSGFDQAGTQADPFLISNVKSLGDVARCGTLNTYFKQTANITLPVDWSGDQIFAGHYDGDNKKIMFSPNTPITHDTFGVWGQSASDSSLVNLDVSGDLDAGSNSTIGLLFGYNAAQIKDSKFSGSITTSGGNYNIGGVVALSGALLDNVQSTVDITATGGAGSVGGVAGYFWGTMLNSSWAGNITMTGSSGEVGGLVGSSDCMTMARSSATGSISVNNGSSYDIGGAVGSMCGNVSDSVARVEVTSNSADNVGGFAGWSSADVYRIAAYGSVRGRGWVGGLIGYASGGSATDVVAHGDASNNNSEAASLFAHIDNFTLQNAYATGSVSADSGPLGALSDVHDVNLSNVHWVPAEAGGVVPSNPLPGQVAYTAEDETSLAFYQNEGWNISDKWSDALTWTICTGVDDHKPFLTSLFSSDPCFKDFAHSTAPQVTGNGWVGTALGVDAGTWDAGVAFTYQWKLDGNNIANATASTYTPVDADIGKTVTVEITGSKQGFIEATKLSSNGIVVAAVPAGAVEKSSGQEVLIGEFAGNSWWIPVGFVSSVKSAVRAHHKATTLTCTGIVAPGGTKAWLKTLGLKRAVLACSIATGFNSKLKTKLAWRVSKKNAKVKRGAGLKFNK